MAAVESAGQLRGDVTARSRLLSTSGWALLAIVLLVVLAAAAGFRADFPGEWNLGIAERVDALARWVISARASHPLFVYGFGPLTDLMAAAVSAAEGLLAWLGWVAVVVGVVLLAAPGGVRLATTTAAGLMLLGLLGLWTESMETLALMGVAVLVSLALGVPLGILAGRSDRVEGALRGVLDAMQTLPAYVYLLPTVLLFSIGDPAALIATVVYALPPAVRLTSFGIRSVPAVAVEVGTAFGATSRQLLRKVQLPLAAPSIMAGVNQTIMMALSIAVIAALVGGGGLGREVLRGLQSIDVGKALDAGIAIVVLAILADRISGAWGRRAGRRARRPGTARFSSGRARFALGVGSFAAVVAAGYALPLGEFPLDGLLSVQEPANAVVAWLRQNLFAYADIAVVGGTGAFSDFLTLYVLNPLRAVLVGLPWWLLTAGVAVLALRTVGAKTALLSVVALVVIGVLGMWDLSMDTLSQVLLAAAIAVVVAVPIGILAARSDAFDAALRPVLDAAQTMPAFVYLIPVIALFNVGRVPGLIAAVVYALPPAIRLTDLGIRQLPAETIEAARSAGATSRQLLTKVQLPLAKPSIMLGVNQTILMVLAGVIIAGLVGSTGLGLEVVFGLTRTEIGRGVEAGVSIVLLGVVLDRITQAYGRLENRIVTG